MLKQPKIHLWRKKRCFSFAKPWSPSPTKPQKEKHLSKFEISNWTNYRQRNKHVWRIPNYSLPFWGVSVLRQIAIKFSQDLVKSCQNLLKRRGWEKHLRSNSAVRRFQRHLGIPFRKLTYPWYIIHIPPAEVRKIIDSTMPWLRGNIWLTARVKKVGPGGVISWVWPPSEASKSQNEAWNGWDPL